MKMRMKEGKRILSRIEYDKNINPNDLKNWFASKSSILVSTKKLLTPEMDTSTITFLIQTQNYQLLEDSYLIRNPRFNIESGEIEFELDEGITLPEGYRIKVIFYKLIKEANKPLFYAEEDQEYFNNLPPVASAIFPYVYLAKEELNETIHLSDKRRI
jgi:hypothetical protein